MPFGLFGRGLPRSRPGQVRLSAATLNAAAEALARVAPASGSGSNAHAVQLPGGVASLAPDRTWVRKAMTGVGGIAVATDIYTPTFGAVTLCDWDPTAEKWVVGSLVIQAANMSVNLPVTASALVTLLYVPPIWEVVIDPC